MFRRIAVLAVGLAMTAGAGLAGAGAASAASPALHIKADAKWTEETVRGGCEIDTFAANGTFTGDVDPGDTGTWSGGGTTITMHWTGDSNPGLSFSGTFTTTPVKEYKGTLRYEGAVFSGKLVKGAISRWGGEPFSNS